MFKSSMETLEQFKQVLLELPANCYSQPCKTLSDASIGQHTRHIIELYLCLVQGYDFSKISYDRRERNLQIEEDLSYALECISYIQQHLEKPNKPIRISYELGGEENDLDSNYFREVMYNLEHHTSSSLDQGRDPIFFQPKYTGVLWGSPVHHTI